MGRDPTLTGRTEVWKLVLTLAGNPLWGTGFESFWLGHRLEQIWAVYWWHPNEAHNGYIEMFLNLGWIGIFLFGVLLITGYRNVINAFRHNPEMGRVRIAYFFVTVVYNFTESVTRMLSPVWIFFLLATMKVSEPAQKSPASPRHGELGTKDKNFAKREPVGVSALRWISPGEL
jgi:O-antigen ligase